MKTMQTCSDSLLKGALYCLEETIPINVKYL